MKINVIYPADKEPLMSKTNIAEEVFTGYKFSRSIQAFLLDYAFKLYSQVPLSDEVKQDGYEQ